jgi:hypothetical protein
VPPQDQRALESRGGPQLVIEGGGDGQQAGELSQDQGPRLGSGPVE